MQAPGGVGDTKTTDKQCLSVPRIVRSSIRTAWLAYNPIAQLTNTRDPSLREKPTSWILKHNAVFDANPADMSADDLWRAAGAGEEKQGADAAQHSAREAKGMTYSVAACPVVLCGYSTSADVSVSKTQRRYRLAFFCLR